MTITNIFRITFVLTMLLGVGLSKSQAESPKPEIKIGVIVPLTGDMAPHGIEIQRAMDLALAEVDQTKTDYAYRLVFEDNQLDGTKSVSAAQRLINIEKVDAIVTLWPPTASVVIPISEKAGVLHYTIAWDPDLAKKNKYVLSHQAMVDAIARSTLKLLKSEKKSRVAFLHLEEAGFNLGAKYLRELAPAEGITLVADEAFNGQETDFRSLITRIQRKSPDAFLIWSVMPSIDALIHQIKNQAPDAFITGYFDYAQDLSQIQKTPYVSEMFASAGFLERYQAKYSVNPVSKGPNAYDIAKLLVSAFEKFPEKKPSAAELKTYLTGIRDFPGAVGKFSIDRDGNSSYQPVTRTTKGPEPKIKLGAIVSLTGDAAENGKNWFEGAQLAVDELTLTGTEVELVVEDDGTVPGRAASAFVKLATIDQVRGIVGGTWDFLAETVYPLAERYRTPFITPTNPVEILSASAQSNPWIFTNGLSLAAERVAIEAFFDQQKLKEISLVYINVPYGISHADLLRKVAQEKKIRVVTDTEISYQGFHDAIKLAALQVAEKKSAAVFVVLNYEGVDLFLRELERLRTKPVILMTHTLKEAYDFGKSETRYEKSFGIYPGFSGVSFGKSFEKKFGHAPYDCAAAGYDAIMFLAELVKQTPPGETPPTTLTYDGVTGRHELSSQNRGLVHGKALIMAIKDGNLGEILMTSENTL